LAFPYLVFSHRQSFFVRIFLKFFFLREKPHFISSFFKGGGALCLGAPSFFFWFGEFFPIFRVWVVPLFNRVCTGGVNALAQVFLIFSTFGFRGYRGGHFCWGNLSLFLSLCEGGPRGFWRAKPFSLT